MGQLTRADGKVVDRSSSQSMVLQQVGWLGHTGQVYPVCPSQAASKSRAGSRPCSSASGGSTSAVESGASVTDKVVIANVSGGDWSQQPYAWQAAAKRWRDRWHETLPGGNHDLVEA